MTDAKCPCGEVHNEPRNFYVSTVDAGKVGLLAGPFATHPEALDRVEECRRIAEKVTGGRSYFYAFGTLAMPLTYSKPGLLNDRLSAQEQVVGHG